MSGSAATLRTLACLALIAFSVGCFVATGPLRSYQLASDINHYYTAGLLWNEGRNPYDRDQWLARLTAFLRETGRRSSSNDVWFYPPQTSALLAPLARLPFATAHGVVLAINLVLLTASMGLLALILSWYRPVGLLEITLLASLVNTGYGRGNVREGQLGILVFALLLATLIAKRYGRDTAAGCSLGLVSLKPSFLPLFVAYHLVQRSYRLVAVCLLTIAALTLLPLVAGGFPVVDTLSAWFSALRGITAGNVNDPSPFVPDSAALVHLEPVVYRLLNAQSPLTAAAVWLILLGLAAYTARLMTRSRAQGGQELIDFALTSCLSLLLLYHRSYDLFLLIPGVLAIYLHTLSVSDPTRRRRWAALLVLVIVAMFLPGDLLVRVTRSRPELDTYYPWRVVCPFQAWTSIAVLAALLWVKRQQVGPATPTASTGCT
jgi:hypothetical protein